MILSVTVPPLVSGFPCLDSPIPCLPGRLRLCPSLIPGFLLHCGGTHIICMCSISQRCPHRSLWAVASSSCPNPASEMSYVIWKLFMKQYARLRLPSYNNNNGGRPTLIWHTYAAIEATTVGWFRAGWGAEGVTDRGLGMAMEMEIEQWAIGYGNGNGRIANGGHLEISLCLSFPPSPSHSLSFPLLI